MIIVKVTYTVNAGYAAQNQANIQQVMAALRAQDNAGINYHVCLSADEQTFIHTAFFKAEEDRKILNSLPAFIHFQQQLKASIPEVPPRQELLSLVGSTREIFGE